MVTGSCRLSAGSINPMDSSDIRCNSATFASTQQSLDSTSALDFTSALDSFAKVMICSLLGSGPEGDDVL